MKVRIVALLAVCAVAAGPASAFDAFVALPYDDLAANGWKATAAAVWHSNTNASVTASQDYGPAGAASTGPAPGYTGTSGSRRTTGESALAVRGLPLRR